MGTAPKTRRGLVEVKKCAKLTLKLKDIRPISRSLMALGLAWGFYEQARIGNGAGHVPVWSSANVRAVSGRRPENTTALGYV